MQITVTIPDETAARVRACGLTPESYVERLIAEQSPAVAPSSDKLSRLADLESFFAEMAAHSDRVPILRDDALSRDSFYRDHD